MKLHYHKGENFGDAINPRIFNHYLGNLIDSNDDEILIGIGSLLGLFKKPANCKKVYIFSSGFGAGDESTYGSIIKLTDEFEVICVRGKLTAKELNIDTSFAIADGAILLPLVTKIDQEDKIYDFSFMPHVGSLNVYKKWKEVLTPIGIHLIDPSDDPDKVLKELGQTKTLLTEAMHGAIIADAYRIPFIPIKTIKTINNFKWNDYLNSMGLADFNPALIDTLYDKSFLVNLFKNKLGKIKILAPIFAEVYFIYQKIFIVKKVQKKFISAKLNQPLLSDSITLKQNQEKLLIKIKELKDKLN